MIKKISKTIILIFSLSILSYSFSAVAGACLCVNGNGEEITEFTCKNITGSTACGVHCDAGGFEGTNYYPDETCDSLHKKIKKETITVPIPDISTIIQVIDVVDGRIISETSRNIASSEDLSQIFLKDATAVNTRTVLKLTGSFMGQNDTFEVPDTFGGGLHTTSSFGGGFSANMTPSVDDPNVMDIVLTSVDTIAASMNLNGFETGALNGSLNPAMQTQGEYNTVTGRMWIFFSQILVSDDFPGYPITTWTTYAGDCNDCLNGGTLTFDGDSIYVSPVE